MKPSAKINLTPNIYDKFFAYYRRNGNMSGKFFYLLEDDGLSMRTKDIPDFISEHVEAGDLTDEEKELAGFLKQMTTSQINKLSRKLLAYSRLKR